MAGIKITDLPAAPSAQLTDVFPVDQLPGPVTYKESNQQLLSLFQSNGAPLTKTDDTNVTMTLGGSPNTALLNAASITLGWTGQLSVPRGGTGNSTFTAYSVICAGTTATGAFQNVVGLGNAGEQLTSNGAGALPTWQAGTSITPSALTRVDDTNITLTLGGTPNTALLQAVSITAGWAGQLSLARGGSNANLTAVNGGVVYSNATAMAISAAGLAGQLFQSAGAGTPVWTTATYPATAGTSGNILTSDGTNWTSASAAGVGSPLTTKGDLYTFTTVNARLAVGGTNGQILQVNSGAATGLAWSTATFPSTANNAARILRSDGTNWVETTATFADTYAASGFLYANGANNVAGLATANNGLPVTSNTGVPSILAGPGTTGNILQSNAAAAPSWSTATYPSVATSSGTILRANGSNWVASTATFADTYTASNILYSNGANTVTGLATANNRFLTTDGSGIPSLSNTYLNTSYTPVLTLVGGAGNTVPVYTVNSGLYTTIGGRTFVDITLEGDGGAEGAGTGVVNISLPVTASASIPSNTNGRWIQFGSAVNGGAQYMLVGTIGASATTLTLRYWSALLAITNFAGNDQNNATRNINLSFSYLT